jgi:hypothetical protein
LFEKQRNVNNQLFKLPKSFGKNFFNELSKTEAQQNLCRRFVLFTESLKDLHKQSRKKTSYHRFYRDKLVEDD